MPAARQGDCGATAADRAVPLCGMSERLRYAAGMRFASALAYVEQDDFTRFVEGLYGKEAGE